MKKLLIIGSLFLAQISIAQTKLHSVLVLNEGRYDYTQEEQVIPVTLGSYDPEAKAYSTIDTIEGVRFASDLLIHEDIVLIAADSFLIKLNRYDYTEIARAPVRGIRKIAIHEDKVYLTKGEYLVDFNAFFEIYNLNDLSLYKSVDKLSGPKYAAEGLIVHDDKVYVAVNNGFDFGNEVGIIGVYNSSTEQYESEIILDNAATNPDNLMLGENGIYTLNNHDYTESSVSEISFGSSTSTTTQLVTVSTGCGTSALYGGKVLYQELYDQVVYDFDPNTKSLTDSFTVNSFFYALEVEPNSSLLYATSTDYLSSGALLVYDNWDLVDSVEISVSAGNIAFDYRSISSVSEMEEESIMIYPNPANDIIQISGVDAEKLGVEVFNIAGQSVLVGNANKIDVSGLSAGVYTVQVQTNESSVERKLIVQ